MTSLLGVDCSQLLPSSSHLLNSFPPNISIRKPENRNNMARDAHEDNFTSTSSTCNIDRVISIKQNENRTLSFKDLSELSTSSTLRCTGAPNYLLIGDNSFFRCNNVIDLIHNSIILLPLHNATCLVNMYVFSDRRLCLTPAVPSHVYNRQLFSLS